MALDFGDVPGKQGGGNGGNEGDEEETYPTIPTTQDRPEGSARTGGRALEFDDVPQAGSQPTGRPEDSPSSQFIVEGITQVLGMPIDALNMGMGALGSLPGTGALDAYPLKQPWGGSQWFQDEMLPAASPNPGERPDSFGDYLAREMGATVTGGLVGVGGTAQLPGRGATATAFREGARRSMSKPFSSGAVDVTAGAGAAAGAYGGEKAAEELNLPPEAGRAVGELVGGFGLGIAGPLALRSAGNMAAKSPAGRLTRGVKNLAVERPSTVRVKDRMQTLAGGPEEAGQARRNLDRGDVLPEAPMTPAAKSESPHLLALERRVAEENPALAKRLQHQLEAVQQTSRRALRDLGQGGTIGDTKAFLADRRQRALDALNLRSRQAAQKVRERIRALGPDASQADTSRIVREELEGALDDARRQEDELWAMVPRNVQVSTDTTRQTYQKLLGSRAATADPEDVPRFIRENLGDLRTPKGESAPRLTGGRVGQEAPVEDMQTLRSRILREMRAERAKDAPNREKLDLLGDLQASILDDMGAAQGRVQGELGESLRQALDFSNTLNQKFTRGTVGRVLGFERRGGERIPPEMTLDQTVGKPGRAGAVATDDVLQALDRAPEEGRRRIQEYLREGFRAQAVNEDDTVSPAAARRFLERNKPTLERFPELREQIRGLAEAQTDADVVARRNRQLTDKLSKGNVSRLSLFLDAPVDKEIQQILKASDPGEAMGKLVNAAGKDPSGRALRGLKSAFADHLQSRASTGQMDDAGEVVLSGSRLRDAISDPRTQRALNQLYTPEERDRLNRITKTLLLEERREGALPNIGQSVEREGAPKFIETLARVGGAAAGRKLNTGTIQVPQIVSERHRALVNRIFGAGGDRARQLISDAVQDEELFRALMTPMSDKRRATQAVNRLEGWLAGPAATAVGAEEEPAPPENQPQQ